MLIDYQPWRLWDHPHSVIFSMKFKCLLFLKLNFVLKATPDNCLFSSIEQKREIGGFYLFPCLEFHLP